MDLDKRNGRLLGQPKRQKGKSVKLNTIIKDWPSDDQYNTRYRRVVRAAKKIPLIQGDKINANSEVTEEEIRRIIKVMPKSTPGYEHAETFLFTHPEGFPEQKWKQHCEERRFEKTEAYRAIEEGLNNAIREIDQKVNKVIDWANKMEDKIQKMEDEIQELKQEKRR